MSLDTVYCAECGHEVKVYHGTVLLRSVVQACDHCKALLTVDFKDNRITKVTAELKET